MLKYICYKSVEILPIQLIRKCTYWKATFIQKLFLKFSQNSLEKNCVKVLSCRGLRLAILLKKRLQPRCFSVNFANIFKIAFLRNTSGGCFRNFLFVCPYYEAQINTWFINKHSTI